MMYLGDTMRRYMKYFDILKEVAMANDKVARARIAAAIVYRRRLISIGINSYKSSPFQLRFAKNQDAIFFHAEISAIKNALRNIEVDDLKSATLLVCRMKYFPEFKQYGYGLAYPCQGCMRAIQTFEIPHILYTGEFSEICQISI